MTPNIYEIGDLRRTRVWCRKGLYRLSHLSPTVLRTRWVADGDPSLPNFKYIQLDRRTVLIKVEGLSNNEKYQPPYWYTIGYEIPTDVRVDRPISRWRRLLIWLRLLEPVPTMRALKTGDQ